RIERILLEIAKQCDRIALYVAAKAFRTGLVINSDPKERHRRNHLTHFAFERVLGRAYVGRRIVAVSPTRTIIAFARHERRPNDQSEHRSPVIAATSLLLPAMLLEPAPELRPRAFHQCMGADAHDTRPGAAVRPDLSVFHEEVYASPRPSEPPGANSQPTSTAHFVRERAEQPIEVMQI